MDVNSLFQCCVEVLLATVFRTEAKENKSKYMIKSVHWKEWYRWNPQGAPISNLHKYKAGFHSDIY